MNNIQAFRRGIEKLRQKGTLADWLPLCDVWQDNFGSFLISEEDQKAIQEILADPDLAPLWDPEETNRLGFR